MVLTPAPAGAGGKHALLIGIDHYPLLGERWSLRGCVRDVESMALVLRQRFAFPDDSIVLLRDGEATAEAIRDGLAALRARTHPGDVVVVHYSGHGSWRHHPARPSGREETLVPADSGRDPHPNRDVADTEIEAWLAKIGRVTPYVTLIFDSCFSGSATREPFARSRGVPGDHRPAAGGKPTPAPAATRELGERPEKGASGWHRPGDRYVLLAACRADEHAYEHGDSVRPEEVHGALTYHLCRALVTAEGRDATTYRDVWESVAAEVTREFPAQHPQLEGARDRLVLGTGELRPWTFLPVRARNGTTIVLDGGALHGVTAGSEWGIYPPATKSPRGDARLGRVRALPPSATSAEAEIVEEREAAVAAGCRAFEELRLPGEMLLAVAVTAPPAERARLDAAIEGSLFLRAAAPGERGGVQVYALDRRDRVEPGDPVPQLGPLQAGAWAAVGGDGRLMVPAIPRAAPGAESRLVGDLERWARHRNLRRLADPFPRTALSGCLEVTLLRSRSPGEWDEVDSGREIEVVYHVGDRLGLAIRHRHVAPLFVHVFDLGVAGAVHLLYPPPGAIEPLAAGHVLELGRRPGQDLRLYFPDGFPIDPGAPPEGQEEIKVLATSCPSDFSALTQEGFRPARPAAARGGGALGELLRLALGGRGRRDLPSLAAPAGEEWTVVGRPFLLRRPDR